MIKTILAATFLFILAQTGLSETLFTNLKIDCKSFTLDSVSQKGEYFYSGDRLNKNLKPM